MKNYLWNMFSNIKNGQLAKHSFILQKRKKICEEILKILWNEGFILGYRIDSIDTSKLKIFLKYKDGQPIINAIKPISKPSRKIYYSAKQLWKIDSGKQVIIISTNQGMKSLVSCKKLNLGGEPLISIN
jgi:small subunit ribosomal protein S8